MNNLDCVRLRICIIVPVEHDSGKIFCLFRLRGDLIKVLSRSKTSALLLLRII